MAALKQYVVFACAEIPGHGEGAEAQGVFYYFRVGDDGGVDVLEE